MAFVGEGCEIGYLKAYSYSAYIARKKFAEDLGVERQRVRVIVM